MLLVIIAFWEGYTENGDQATSLLVLLNAETQRANKSFVKDNSLVPVQNEAEVQQRGRITFRKCLFCISNGMF